MAWFELFGGLAAALFGLVLLLGAANTPAPSSETDRYAVYGFVIAIAGVLFFLMGGITLLGHLIRAIG